MYSSFLSFLMFASVCWSKITPKMGLGSAPIFSAPPVYKQQQKHLQSAFRARRPFPKSYVSTRNMKMHSSERLHKSDKFRVFCGQVKVGDSISDEEACELVNGTELTIGGDADGIQAHLFTAVKNNNETGILLLSDIFGFEDDSTRDFAYRVACNGYNVLVPDLFNGDPWTKDRPKALLEEWITKHNPEHVANTVFASAEWMISEFAAVGISKKLGIIGFCYGGGRVVDVLAQDKGTHFGSGVSFYGTRIDSSIAGNIKVPLLLVTGESDPLCPVSVLEGITERNKELFKMVVFRGRGHGFAHRPQTPEEDADAEDAFVMMRNWLHDALFVKN